MRIDIDHRAIEGLKRHPGVRAEVLRNAKAVLNQIQRTAPVRTGEYRDSWTVIPMPDGSAHVSSDSWKIWFVEHGARAHGNYPPWLARHTAFLALQFIAGRR